MERYPRDHDDRGRGYYDRPRSDTYRPRDGYRSDKDPRDLYDRPYRDSPYHSPNHVLRAPDPYPNDPRYGYHDTEDRHSPSRNRSPSHSSSRSPRRTSYSHFGSRSSSITRRSPSPNNGSRRDSYIHRPHRQMDPGYLPFRGGSSSFAPIRHSSPPRHYSRPSSRSPPPYFGSRDPPPLPSSSYSRLPPSARSPSRSSYSYAESPRESRAYPHYPPSDSRPSGFSRSAAGFAGSRSFKDSPSQRPHDYHATPPPPPLTPAALHTRESLAPEQEKEIEHYESERRKLWDEESQALASVRKVEFELAWAEWETIKGEHQLELVQRQWDESGMTKVLEDATTQLHGSRNLII